MDLKLLTVTFLFFQLCSPSLAATKSSENQVQLFELGPTLGTPSVLNLSTGYWGKEDISLIARLTVGYAILFDGIQLDFGIGFTTEHIRYGFTCFVVHMGYIAMGNNTVISRQTQAVGASFIFEWRHLFFQGGLGVIKDFDFRDPFGLGDYNTHDSTTPVIQIGYMWRI